MPNPFLDIVKRQENPFLKLAEPLSEEQPLSFPVDEDRLKKARSDATTLGVTPDVTYEYDKNIEENLKNSSNNMPQSEVAAWPERFLGKVQDVLLESATPDVLKAFGFEDVLEEDVLPVLGAAAKGVIPGLLEATGGLIREQEEGVAIVVDRFRKERLLAEGVSIEEVNALPPIDPTTFGKDIADFWGGILRETQPEFAPNSLKRYGFLIASNVMRNAPWLILGAVTGQPALALAPLGLQAKGAKFQQLREGGEDFGVASDFSTLIGVSEILTERLPFGQLVKTGVPFAKRLLLVSGLDVPGELINTAIESAVDKVTITPDMTMGDFTQSLIETAIVSLGSAGIITTAIHPLVNGRELEEKKEKIVKDMADKRKDELIVEQEKVITDTIEEIRKPAEVVEEIEEIEPIPEEIIREDEVITDLIAEGVELEDITDEIITERIEVLDKALTVEADKVITISDKVEKVPTAKVKGQVRRATGLAPAIKTIREDQALNAAFKKAEQASRVAFREGKREEAQVAKVQIQKVIEQAREKIERKKIISNLKNIEKKNAKSNVAVDYKKKIDELIKGIDIKNLTSKKRKSLEGIASFIEKEGVPLGIQPRHLKELKRLSQKQPKDMTTEDLRSLRDTVKHLRALGRLKLKLSKFADERVFKERQSSLIEDTINLDRHPPQTRFQRHKDRKANDAFYDGAQWLYLNTLHTFRVTDMIDGMQNFKGENTRLIKNMIQNEQNYHTKNTERLSTYLEGRVELLGEKELTDTEASAVMIHGRFQEGAFDAVNVLSEEYGYNIPEDAVITNTKELSKYVPISDKLLKYVDLIRKTTTSKTDDIAALHEEITNTVFDRVDNYFAPLLYEREAAVEPSALIREDFKDTDPSGNLIARTKKTAQGFTKARITGVRKVPRIDIETIVSESISAQEWYLNMQPALLETSSLVLSKDYQKAAGTVASNWWRNQLDIVSRKGWQAGNRNTAFSNVMRITRGNLNRGILLFKASTVMMQPFAILDAVAYSQAKFGTRASVDIAQEFLKAWFVPKYAKKIIEASQALQQRKGGELALEEIIQEANKSDRIFNKLSRIGSGFIMGADVRTAAAVQQGFQNTLERLGIANAKTEAEFLMNATQGSANVTSRPHILASGEGARLWFTFQTFFLNRWGLIANDLIRGGIKAKGYRTKVTSLVGLAILIAGGFAEDEAREILRAFLGQEPLPKKDDEIIKDILFYVPEQMPYAGNVIEGARRGWGGTDIPIENVFKRGVRGGVNISRGRVVKGIAEITEAALILKYGIPGTTQVFDILESFEEDKKKHLKR